MTRPNLKRLICPTPWVFLRKSVILGELDCAFAQECEFKGISDDLWCWKVGNGVVRMNK
jgi:hypothetical protein